MMRKHQEQNAIRRYLLDQLSESEKQNVELRLLRDEDFSEELEMGEDELIDEYIARELSPDERFSFEKTFLAHPERKRKLEAGQALKRYLDATPVTPKPTGWLESMRKWLSQFFFSSPTGVFVTLLVVAVVGLATWRVFFYQSDLDKGLLALNKAYSEQRPIEPRVSNLKYARFISTRSDEPKRVNEFERGRAERFLTDALEDNRNANSYHALGQLFLLQGDTAKAIENLEQARTAGPNNARIYADLGAAYLEKAKAELEDSATEQGPEGKGLSDLGRSLDYLKQALELDPNLPEALFNRALVHQYQKLYNLAKSDWEAYLKQDSSSPWAAEAQQRLKELEEKKNLGSQSSDKPIELFMRAYHARDENAAWDIYKLKQGPQGSEVTNALVDGLLAESVNDESSENLQALNYLGQLEIRKTQDSYTSDLSRAYAAASPTMRTRLAQARKQLVKGRELIGQSQINEANELLVSSLATFKEAGDLPEALTAETAMAQGAAIQPDLPRGQEILARIMPMCEAKHYPRLLAQTLFHRAHINSNLNNYSQAISDGNQALQIFQRLEDLSGTLSAFGQLANLHLFLNDIDTSFSYLQRALAVAEKNETKPTQIWGLYTALSLDLSALKLYRAALDYQNEALELILPVPKTPLYHSRSYQYIGLTYASLGRFDSAVENLRLAYDQGKALASDPTGQNMMASASLALGNVYRAAGDLDSALSAYDESMRLYGVLGFNHYQYSAHKGKLLSYLAQDNDSMAARELQIVIELFDQYREKILEERQKSFFFDREQDVYDLAIDFAYSRLGDNLRAFDYSETCRARNLRDLMRKGAEVTQSDRGLDLRVSEAGRSKPVAPLTATQVEDNLPDRLQLVQFAVLEKKLLVWHLTRSGIYTKSVPIESSQLGQLVATALMQIRQRDQAGATSSLKKLYSFIIEPIKEKLDQNRVLCVIPDKMLHNVPFSALISTDGRFLAQDFSVLVSPSASTLIESTRNAVERPLVKQEHLLAVGNPAFDRQANPNLANLPGAQREVEQIARSYDSRNLLITRQATRKLIMAELPKADVAHFAAHYQIDPRSNLLSKLLLAPESGERAHAHPSALQAGDIYSMNLEHLRLVVLAACDTGIEQQFQGEGPIGFARSFLVAGVPVVVASLWPVDSEATADLMIAFHRYRKQQHVPVTEALMRAQQEIMNKENYRDPYYWAGFIVVGGYSDF